MKSQDINLYELIDRIIISYITPQINDPCLSAINENVTQIESFSSVLSSVQFWHSSAFSLYRVSATGVDICSPYSPKCFWLLNVNVPLFSIAIIVPHAVVEFCSVQFSQSNGQWIVWWDACARDYVTRRLISCAVLDTFLFSLPLPLLTTPLADVTRIVLVFPLAGHTRCLTKASRPNKSSAEAGNTMKWKIWYGDGRIDEAVPEGGRVRVLCLPLGCCFLYICCCWLCVFFFFIIYCDLQLNAWFDFQVVPTPSSRPKSILRSSWLPPSTQS